MLWSVNLGRGGLVGRVLGADGGWWGGWRVVKGGRWKMKDQIEGKGEEGGGEKKGKDVQMRAHGFLGSDVVDVSPGDAETAGGSGEAARAGAGGGDGAEVGAVGGVAEVEGT
jgi:hypothetical protein